MKEKIYLTISACLKMHGNALPDMFRVLRNGTQTVSRSREPGTQNDLPQNERKKVCLTTSACSEICRNAL